MQEPVPEELEATVHQSILEPILVWWAPYRPAFLNFFVCLAVLAQFRLWLWIPLAAAVHGVLVWAASIDQFLVDIVQRSFRYYRYYGV